jgi:glycine/D-amino acid oxidase-like deaminating enzyme
MSNDVFTETLDSAAPAIVFEFAGPRADFETISLPSADRCNPSAQASALLMLNRPLGSLGFFGPSEVRPLWEPDRVWVSGCDRSD